jgi:hypothetical protein
VIWIRDQWMVLMGLYRPQESFSLGASDECWFNLQLIWYFVALALGKLDRNLDTKGSPLFQPPRIHQGKHLEPPIVHI